MTVSGVVSIRLSVDGTRAVQSALRGVIRDAQNLERMLRGEAQSTTTQVVRARRGMTTALQEASREGVTVARRGEQEIRTEVGRTTREVARSAHAQADAVIRERRRAGTGGGGSGRGGRRGGAAGGLAIGAGVVAGVGAAVGRAEAYGAAGGVRDSTQLATDYANYRVRGTRIAHQSGVARSDIDARVMEVAHQSGVDPMELLGGLETAQGRFDNVRGAMGNLQQTADIHRATGAEIQDIVGAQGEAQRAFGLSDEESSQFSSMMVDAGNRGSIDFPQLAGSFAATFGEMRRGTGHRGLAGARDALTIAELGGGGGMSADETATGAARFVNELSDTGVQRRLARHGVHVMGEDGQMRSMTDIVRDMAGSESLGRPGALHGVFRDERSRRMAGVLRQQASDNPELLTSLENVTAESGAQFVHDTTRDLNNDAGDRFLRQGTDQMVNFAQNGNPEQFLNTMTMASSSLANLTAQYPLASEALGVLTTAAQAAGLTLGAIGLAGGGGAAGGGGLAALLGGGAATGGGAAGGGLIASVLGGGALAAGGAAAAAALVTLYASTAGGDSGLDTEQGKASRVSADSLGAALDATGARPAYADAMRQMTPEQRRAMQMASSSAVQQGMTLTPDVIRTLAEQTGRAVATAIDRGIPAGGRESGVPGRSG